MSSSSSASLSLSLVCAPSLTAVIRYLRKTHTVTEGAVGNRQDVHVQRERKSERARVCVGVCVKKKNRACVRGRVSEHVWVWHREREERERDKRVCSAAGSSRAAKFYDVRAVDPVMVARQQPAHPAHPAQLLPELLGEHVTCPDDAARLDQRRNLRPGERALRKWERWHVRVGVRARQRGDRAPRRIETMQAA